MDYTKEGKIIREMFRLRNSLMDSLSHRKVYKITYVDYKLLINRYFVEMSVRFYGGYGDFNKILCRYIDLLMDLRKYTDEELATSVKANGWEGEFDLNAYLVLIASVIRKYKSLLIERNNKELLERYEKLVELLKTNKLKLITVEDSHTFNNRAYDVLDVYRSKELPDGILEIELEYITRYRDNILLRAEKELNYDITDKDSVSLFNSNLLNSVLNIEDNDKYTSDIRTIVKRLMHILNEDSERIDKISKSKFELPYSIKPKEDLITILDMALRPNPYKESIANIRKHILRAGIPDSPLGVVRDGSLDDTYFGVHEDYFMDFVKCLD